MHFVYSEGRQTSFLSFETFECLLVGGVVAGLISLGIIISFGESFTLALLNFSVFLLMALGILHSLGGVIEGIGELKRFFNGLLFLIFVLVWTALLDQLFKILS